MYIKIITSVLLLWFGISLVRTASNFSKLYSEELGWIKKNAAQKELMLFGRDFMLFDYIKNSTSQKGNVVIFSSDAKPYLYGRYYLYPRKIIQVRSIDELEKSLKNNKNSLFILYTPVKKNSFLSTLIAIKTIDQNIIIAQRK